MTKQVAITITGAPDAGKTTLAYIINRALKVEGFQDVEIDWGADGEPPRSADEWQGAVDRAAQSTKVLIQDFPKERTIMYAF